MKPLDKHFVRGTKNFFVKGAYNADDDQSGIQCSLKEVSVALERAGTYMAGTYEDYPRLLKKLKKLVKKF